MPVKRLNISIPEDLYKDLQHYRDEINVSHICQAALVAEINRVQTCRMIQAKLQTATELIGKEGVKKILMEELRKRSGKK